MQNVISSLSDILSLSFIAYFPQILFRSTYFCKCICLYSDHDN